MAPYILLLQHAYRSTQRQQTPPRLTRDRVLELRPFHPEEDPMVKSIVLFLGVVGAVTIVSQEAAATKRCAPIPVQNTGGPICKCSVQNYSTVADAGVKIDVYAENGGFTTCGPSTV